MHAKGLSLLIICTLACGESENKGSTLVTAKSTETMQAKAPAKPVKAVTPTAPPQVELTEEETWELIRALYDEGIGPIKMDMPASEMIAAIGKPTSKGKELLEEATGLLVQRWNYQGAWFNLARESKKATPKIVAIQAVEESPLVTKRGIRVGSTRAQVETAYAKERNAEDSDKETFVAGSMYGGLLFSFENDIVISMFLGAATE